MNDNSMASNKAMHVKESPAVAREDALRYKLLQY